MFRIPSPSHHAAVGYRDDISFKARTVGAAIENNSGGCGSAFPYSWQVPTDRVFGERIPSIFRDVSALCVRTATILFSPVLSPKRNLIFAICLSVGLTLYHFFDNLAPITLDQGNCNNLNCCRVWPYSLQIAIRVSWQVRLAPDT